MTTLAPSPADRLADKVCFVPSFWGDTPGVLDKNLAAMNTPYTSSLDEVRNTPPYPRIRFVPTPDGAFYGDLDEDGQDRALCSRMAPLAEAKRIAEAIDPIRASMVIVWGFGMGWHVRAVCERLAAWSSILVYEPRISLLRAVMGRIDHSAWLQTYRERLHFCIGELSGVAFNKLFFERAGCLVVGVEVVPHLPSMASRDRPTDHAALAPEPVADPVPRMPFSAVPPHAGDMLYDLVHSNWLKH